MAEDKPILLVKLKSGQELIARVQDNDTTYTLHSPATFTQTPDGNLGLDNWPMFAAEDSVVVLRYDDVLCVVPAHEKVVEGYRKYLGEVTIETPPEKKLIVP